MSAATNDDNDPPPLSDYERLRLAKIERNRKRLEALGLLNGPTKKKQKKTPRVWNPTTRQPSNRVTPSSQPVRRSLRLSAVPNKNGGDDEDDDETYAESLIDNDAPTVQDRATQRAMEKIRNDLKVLNEKMSLLQASSVPDDGDAKEQEARCIAVDLWGDLCSPPKNCSWSLYLSSRLPSPSPHLPSPYGLLQERFCHDGWRLLVCCVLMSRVSARETKERCIAAFFELCPRPSDALRVDDPAQIGRVVHSLGFQRERVRAVVEISKAWLTRGEFRLDTVDETKGGHKIYMCGPFACDSYQLFFKGNAEWRETCGIRDISKFSKWLQRDAKKRRSGAPKPDEVGSSGGE